MVRLLAHRSELTVKNAGAAPVSSPAPIKVCMHLLDVGCTDARVMREAKALAEAGFSVSLVDVEDQRNRPDEEELQGINMKHIIMPDWFVATRFKLWFLVKYWLMVMRSTLRLCQSQADIYHAHDERALPACYIAALLRRKPLIFDAHELPLSAKSVRRRPLLHALATRILALLVPYCSGVITVSPPIAQEIRRHYHAPEVTLVRNVPARRIVASSNRLHQLLGLQPGVRIALLQGHLMADRQLDRLIHAARFLEQDIVIVFMGKAEKHVAAELSALIASEGVADRVKILPPVPYEELLDWTASADIGLVIFEPSYSLNIQWCLPNKLFEYLMAGLPVLASRLDAVAEVINTYDVGQVVPSMTPEDIAIGINSLLRNKAALTRMRQNALDAAQQEFYWEKERERLISLYNSILGRRNTHGAEHVCMHALRRVRADVRAMRAATTLVQAGFAVYMVDIDCATQAEEDIEGIHVKHMLVPQSFIKTRFKRMALIKAAWQFMRGCILLLRTPADTYHALDLPALPACYIAAHIRRKPLIFEAYELPLATRPSSELSTSRRLLHMLLVPLLLYMLPRCTRVITVSPPIIEVLQTRYHCREVALIRNVPEYRTVARNDRLRQHLGLCSGVRIALYQGILDTSRGLDVLIHAAAFLEPNIVIVMMGEEDNGARSRLETLIADEGAAERVKILPAVPYAELLEWTASADLGLIVYKLDEVLNTRMMLPNKLFEYLMAGLPVLSSHLEAVCDVIKTHDVGRVLSSLIPEDIAIAINELMADDVALARMHSNALSTAQHVFCWDKEKERLLQLYRRSVEVHI